MIPTGTVKGATQLGRPPSRASPPPGLASPSTQNKAGWPTTPRRSNCHTPDQHLHTHQKERRPPPTVGRRVSTASTQGFLSVSLPCKEKGRLARGVRSSRRRGSEGFFLLSMIIKKPRGLQPPIIIMSAFLCAAHAVQVSPSGNSAFAVVSLRLAKWPRSTSRQKTT